MDQGETVERAERAAERRVTVRRAAVRWVWVRRLVQAGMLLAALGFFVVTARQVVGVTATDPFFLVDPLLGAASMLAARQIVPRLLWGLGLVGLALLAGRAWCGWLCPMGTLLDLAGAPHVRSMRPGWRRAKYLVLTAILGAALLGSLTLVALDPLTLLTRTLATAFFPALNWLVGLAEARLYALPLLRGPLSAAESLLRGPILPYRQPYFPAAWLFGGLFAGILALNLAAPRFWCRALCPLGALLALASRAAWLHRRVDDGCTSCGRCARVCPTGTIDPEHGFRSDPAECTLCLKCLAECRPGAQHLTGSWSLAPAQGYDPSRRQLLLAAGAGLLGVALSRVTADPLRPGRGLLRPPGARDPDLLARCMRCGRCMKACPSAGLQPSLGEAGLEGLWTPVLVPRLGYCDYSCNTCGQVCPTGAIPRLGLEEKRRQVIGTAYIDRNRCIPWTDNRNCICCQEVCPLPEKAIVLDEVEAVAGDSEVVRVQRPRVVRERCIGCGLCENKCPLDSDAAIRVRVDNPTVRVTA